MGSNMAARNQQKPTEIYVATEARYKSANISLKLKVIKKYFFWNMNCSASEISRKSHFFNQHDSSLGRHVNAASGKGLAEIQG